MTDVEIPMESKVTSSKKIGYYKTISNPSIRLKDTSKIHTFYFDVSFSVKQNNKTLILLDNVAEIVQSGEMLAIMGPSGAGKTTLLRVLTQEAYGGRTTGVVNYDGHPMSTSLFQQKCGLVAQEDYHWTFLTAKEAISYAADLYLPNLTSAQRTVEVENMIEKMGLTSCQNTIAGNQFIHGLSGGQKRRLSVAIALMKKLEIVFLDEPTSGLDAAAAAGIMVFLADVTKREHLVTVFTVHQPSTNIFNSFDRVMLLSQGRVAYCGSQKNVPAHLQAIGHPLPPQMNPAEFLLDIVNTDFTEETEVLKVLDNWDSIGKPIQDQRIKQILDNAEKHPVEEEKRSTSGTFFSELWLLLKRHSLLASRDPLIYTGRLAIFLMCCVFFGIVYIHARVRSQDQTLNRFWFIIWICGVPSNMGVIAVYVFNTEFFAIKKEVKNGMVTPVPYLIANTIIQIPVMFILALSSIVIPAYAMMNFQGKHFGQFWLIYAVTLMCFEGLAQMMSVAFANPLLGMLQFVNMWFSAFLFSGIFLPIDNIIWPFRILSYILPYHFTFQMLTYQEFHGSTFHKAVNCDPSTDSSCLSGGYKCESDIKTCYGYTGDQVLSSMNTRYGVVTDSDQFGPYMGVIIAQYVVYKVAYVMMMYMKANEKSAISSSKPETKEIVIAELKETTAQ